MSNRLARRADAAALARLLSLRHLVALRASEATSAGGIDLLEHAEIAYALFTPPANSDRQRPSA